MLAMKDLGLINGKYVVITLEILLNSCKASADAQDGRDAEACAAYEGIIDISQYIPDSQEYKDFTTAVYNRMPEMNYTMDSPNDVCIMSCGIKLCLLISSCFQIIIFYQ